MNNIKVECINLLKIFAMFLILFFHSGAYFNISVIDELIRVGAIGCTIFFMVSGFLLRQNYGELKLFNIHMIKQFFIKRIIALYPSYFIILSTAIIFDIMKGKTISLLIKIIPVQLSLLQIISMPRINDYVDNNNFWFISSLFFLYLFFPFFNEIANGMKIKQKIIVLILLVFISEYLYYINITLGNEYIHYYTNPVLRMPEFFCGILVSDLIKEENVVNSFKGKIKLILTNITAILLIAYIMPKLNLNYYIYFNLYNIIVIPFVSVLIFCMVSNNTLNKIGNNIVIKYIASLGLLLYLCQSIAANILILDLINTQFSHKISYIMITILSALLIHEFIEKPSQKWLRKRFIK